MKKTIYIRYAKDSGRRRDKVEASIKPNFSQLKGQPYDQVPLQTLFLEVEIEIPDEFFGSKKVNVIQQKQIKP